MLPEFQKGRLQQIQEAIDEICVKSPLRKHEFSSNVHTELMDDGYIIIYVPCKHCGHLGKIAGNRYDFDWTLD